MFKDYTTYRVLQLFFDFPSKRFHLREICRMAGLGMPSVRLHIKKLEKMGFIKKEKSGIYQTYISTKNELFKLYKKIDLLVRLYESGLVNFLIENFLPNAIVLFGSASRGEDVETGNIDLLVVASEKDADLKIFEKRLNRKIALHFKPKISEIPKELLNNIINGILVYGYFKVFE
jgi:predicted nucleotidyltransferase